MARAFVGAVAAAVAMFIIGFIFYGTPLQRLATVQIEDGKAAAVQQSLAANLPHTGTYFVPDPSTAAQSTMFSQGPVATVHYNMGGFAVASPNVMIAGFVHMLIVTLLMAAGLFILARYVPLFTDQAKLLAIAILTGTIFMHLGNPIWYHEDWLYSIYLFIADTLSLAAAGLIILKLLPRQNQSGGVAASAPPGSTSDL